MESENTNVENTENKIVSPEFTQLELEGIADALEYLLGAELLEENGFTEDVVDALNSAYAKTQDCLFGNGGT